MSTLSEQLKALRIHLFGDRGGIPKISAMLQIPESTYRSYERRDVQKLPARLVEKLVKHTGVSRVWLLDGEGKMLTGKSGPAGKVADARNSGYTPDDSRARLERIVLRLTDEVEQLRERIAQLERQ